ncbi:MAG TPA: T9SS type A sorting domain-containing protein, partial [Cytophagales bacterium]|nr:T9SS type A sorting domain-containing protein [Cytophagales bacterium]
ALKFLYIYNNGITHLDVSKSPALEMLGASGNPLFHLCVSSSQLPKSATWSVPFQTKIEVCNPGIHIPDTQFKAHLISKGIDTNNDGEIQELEAKAVNKIILPSFAGVKDLTGIEYFTSLDTLAVAYNEIKWIHLFNLRELTYLDVSNNDLHTINVSLLDSLKYLNVADNHLANLDLYNNVLLEVLRSEINQIEYLDLRRNTRLVELYTYFNPLRHLDIRNVTKLKYLITYNNELDSLATSHLSDLEVLYADNNPISYVNLKNNSKLKLLYLANTAITNLDISGKTSLTEAHVNANALVALDASNNPNLTTLRIDDNQISTLNFLNTPQLQTLVAWNNQLTSLDVSKNLQLSYVGVQGNFSLKTICIDAQQVNDTLGWTKDVSAHWVVCNSGARFAVEEEVNFQVYPIPAKDVIQIQSRDAVLKVAVKNVNNEEVVSWQDSTQGDVSSLSAGLYLLEVTTDKGTKVSKLIIE